MRLSLPWHGLFVCNFQIAFFINYNSFCQTEASAIIEQETHRKVNVYEQKETNQKIAEQHETNVRIYDIYQPKSAFYEYRTAAYQAIKNSILMTFPNSTVIPGDCLMHSHLRFGLHNSPLRYSLPLNFPFLLADILRVYLIIFTSLAQLYSLLMELKGTFNKWNNTIDSFLFLYLPSYYTNSERLTLTQYVYTLRFYYNLFVVTTQT